MTRVAWLALLLIWFGIPIANGFAGGILVLWLIFAPIFFLGFMAEGTSRR